jgi:hypothetical protein
MSESGDRGSGDPSDCIRLVINRPRRVRDLLFIDEHTMRVNCGRCGKELLVRLDEIRDERVIDCDRCKQSRDRSHRLADGSSLTA